MSLGPVIGAVSPTMANVWAALDAPGEVRVQARANSAVHDAVGVATPESLLTTNVTLRGLTADTRYEVTVRDTMGSLLGGGQFATLPEAPDRFSFAFASCHRPAAYTSPSAFALWQLLNQKLETDPSFARFLLHIGDQIYADPIYDAAVEFLGTHPEAHVRARQDHYRTLISQWTREYANLYVTHWQPPFVQSVLKRVPNFMLWDDHDIGDGWGSRATSGWDTGKALFTAAGTAYRLFQDRHNPVPGMFPLAFTPTLSTPVCYGYGFAVGKVGFLLPDQRSFRQTYNPTANDETGAHAILGDQQATDLARWLASDAASGLKVLFFIATVPFFHSSPKTIGIGSAIEELDALDNWIAPANQADLGFVLDQLFTWQTRTKGRAIILGGDVHMADVATITAGDQALLQFVSSPITNHASGGLLEGLLVMESNRDVNIGGIKATFRILDHKAVRNFGRISVDLTETDVRIRYEVYAEGAVKPILAAVTLPGPPWLSLE
ncbi:MAG: alkaline phosphatase family protein [Acidobacteriota bacterium]|nr:alkaline phosphatase family protein [Acidobacteriota bacterium]